MELPLGTDATLVEIGKLLAAVVMGAFGYLIAKVRSKAEKNAFWKKCDTTKNLRIKELLQEIIILFDADRTLLFQIHNGEYFVSGESSRKMSLTHFEVGKEIAPISPSDVQCYQGIPLTFMASTFSALENQNCLTIHRSSENVKEFQYPKSLIALGGCESTAILKIPGPKGAVGLLFVCYLNARQTTNSEIKDLRKYVEELGARLTL